MGVGEGLHGEAFTNCKSTFRWEKTVLLNSAGAKKGLSHHSLHHLMKQKQYKIDWNFGWAH